MAKTTWRDTRLSAVAPPHNHRDLAGWRTAGGVVRPGLLTRGALHAEPAPLVRPQHSGLVHLLDLRGEGESAGPVPSWVCAHAWPLQDPQWTHGAARSPAFFVASALRLVPFAAGPVGDAVDLLGRGEPVYVGCRLGKDRTGLVILLLGRLFGVSDDVLIDDYVRTAAEYAAATGWVRHYALARGEDADRVAARLAVTEDVPAGILAGLPGTEELTIRLGLSGQRVRTATIALTDR